MCVSRWRIVARSLPAPQPGHELGDEIVELQPPLLPELEHGDGGQRLAGRVPEHDVVGAQRPPGAALADGHVEHRLALERHVGLGAVVPVGGDAVLEPGHHGGEIRASHGPER